MVLGNVFQVIVVKNHVLLNWMRYLAYLNTLLLCQQNIINIK